MILKIISNFLGVNFFLTHTVVCVAIIIELLHCIMFYIYICLIEVFAKINFYASATK